MTHQQALAKHLEVDEILIDQCKHNRDVFSLRNAEFLVIHADDLDDALADQVKENLWAFRADFIAAHTKKGLSPACIDALEDMQRELAEDCQPIVEALIDDLDRFIRDAVLSDGAGHFLSTYDGKEIVVDEYFIYRLN